MNCWFSFFSNALLSPVSALCSHFCLCGAGRRCLQSWRSTFLVVVHRGQNRFWTCAQGLMSPLHLALFLCRCPVKRTCCHWYKLQRKRTGGCTRYMSCMSYMSYIYIERERSSLLNAVLSWSHRGGMVGTTASPEWTIFMDCLQMRFCEMEQRTAFCMETLFWVISLFTAAGWDFICLIPPHQKK